MREGGGERESERGKRQRKRGGGKRGIERAKRAREKEIERERENLIERDN